METSSGINVQGAPGARALPAAMQQIEQAGRPAQQRCGSFSFDLPIICVVAHLGLRQLCPVLSATVLGHNTGKKPLWLCSPGCCSSGGEDSTAWRLLCPWIAIPVHPPT